MIYMKNYGAKVFNNKRKLRKLLRMAKTNKYSAPKLAKIFNCNKNTILGTLAKFGIRLPNLGRFKKRVYCNTNFFERLIPTSVYWAGFIAADGCLFFRDKSLSIGLKRSDITQLYKFRKAIKANAKINYIRSTKSVNITIYSNKLFKSLIKLGITPNKSKRMGKIKIPLHLMSHFIRGVFDGDGSISGKKITHVQFQIAGYKPFLRQIQNILIRECNVRKVKIYSRKNSKTHILQYTGSQIFRILNFIYKNSTKKTRLERKYKKYIRFKRRFRK